MAGPEPVQHSGNAIPALSETLFWDMRFEEIDWREDHVTIIGRVMERGSDDEIEELLRFYGREYVVHALRYEVPDFPAYTIPRVCNYFKLKYDELRCSKRLAWRGKRWGWESLIGMTGVDEKELLKWMGAVYDEDVHGEADGHVSAEAGGDEGAEAGSIGGAGGEVGVAPEDEAPGELGGEEHGEGQGDGHGELFGGPEGAGEGDGVDADGQEDHEEEARIVEGDAEGTGPEGFFAAEGEEGEKFEGEAGAVEDDIHNDEVGEGE